MTAGGRHEYAVRERHERFRGDVFRVVTDEVAMPEGRHVVRDYVIHLGSVGVAALDDEGRVVLLRQYRHPLGREIWELPAGLIDVPGEQLPATAARELAEEADLTADRWDVLVDLHTSPGYSNELIRIFLARGLAPVPDAARHVRMHEETGMVTRRVGLDEAVRLALTGQITNAACVAGVLAAARARDLNWTTLRPVDAPLPASIYTAAGGGAGPAATGPSGRARRKEGSGQ